MDIRLDTAHVSARIQSCLTGPSPNRGNTSVGIRRDNAHVSIWVSSAHTLVSHWVLWTTHTTAILCVTFEKVHKGLMGLMHVIHFFCVIRRAHALGI